MKLEDLNKLKFTTRHWCILSSQLTNAYMLGFLECKKQVKQLLEKESKEEAKILATHATNDFNIELLVDKIITNKNILEKYDSMAGIDGFKIFIKEEIEQWKIEIKKLENENVENGKTKEN